ncbi:hypothetical protein EPUL_006058, partial [Erysiphe pulchra]
MSVAYTTQFPPDLNGDADVAAHDKKNGRVRRQAGPGVRRRHGATLRRFRAELHVHDAPHACLSQQEIPVKLTEESVVERDGINTLHGRVLQELRIDVEEDWHVHRLALVEPLLLKTETLDLAEIRRNLPRRHT